MKLITDLKRVPDVTDIRMYATCLTVHHLSDNTLMLGLKGDMTRFEYKAEYLSA
jgi:hypothetical protein